MKHASAKLTPTVIEDSMQSQSRVRHYALVVIWLAFASFVPRPIHGQNTTLRNLRYRIFDVGTFGGANSQTNGGGSKIINNDGVVAGEADTDTPCPYFPAFVSPAFKWKNGVLTQLSLLPGACFRLPNAISSNGIIVGASDNGKLDPATGLPELHADATINGKTIRFPTFGGVLGLSGSVNSRGFVVGAAETADPDVFNYGGDVVGGLPSPTTWRAFLWHDGKLKSLGTLGGPDSSATDINENNEINGISFTSSIPTPSGIPPLEPFIWKNAHMRSLGSLGGTFGITANLTSKGETVGFSDLKGDQAAHAYHWKVGQGMKDLGVLGGTFSQATWINEAGEIVGGSTTMNDEAFHAVRWRNGIIEDLGTAAGNSCSFTAQLNVRGELAGQSFNCDGTGEAHAIIWEPTGSAIDLNLFLPPDSNLNLVETHFINDRGEIVVNGLLPNGDEHIVVFVPCSGTDAEGCRAAREDAAQTQSAFSNPTRLTPEMLTKIRNRAMHKFRGIPGLTQK
jgi:probable HAF family extracellular repeat protein